MTLHHCLWLQKIGWCGLTVGSRLEVHVTTTRQLIQGNVVEHSFGMLQIWHLRMMLKQSNAILTLKHLFFEKMTTCWLCYIKRHMVASQTLACSVMAEELGTFQL